MQQIRKKETIVYGGAFNPPTLAHQAIVEACVEYAIKKNADVWLLPSGNREDKTIATPYELRLAYLHALIDNLENKQLTPEIILDELNRETLIETYDTVKALEAKYPDRAFTFVFGADSTETMATWKNGNELLETLQMLLIERHGSTINPLARHAIILDVTPPIVSSTEVRTRLAEGRPIDGLVIKSVAQLLQ